MPGDLKPAGHLSCGLFAGLRHDGPRHISWLKVAVSGIAFSWEERALPAVSTKMFGTEIPYLHTFVVLPSLEPTGVSAPLLE
jgi:hypothetical protein